MDTHNQTNTKSNAQSNTQSNEPVNKSDLTKSETLFADMEPDTKNALNSIVGFFPDYQDVMYKLFTTSQNMSNEINQIRRTIFDEILITYHEESLKYILYVIDNAQQKHTPKYFLALADFIDMIYQNAFYDIFAMKFQELEIVDSEKITEKHLMIFNLIVYVEHIKYKLYEQLESDTVNNQPVKNTLAKRKANSLLRINVCANLLENYPRINDENYDYINTISKYGIFSKNPEFTDKFFKEIN
jgi:hypothetical protein